MIDSPHGRISTKQWIEWKYIKRVLRMSFHHGLSGEMLSYTCKVKFSRQNNNTTKARVYLFSLFDPSNILALLIGLCFVSGIVVLGFNIFGIHLLGLASRTSPIDSIGIGLSLAALLGFLFMIHHKATKIARTKILENFNQSFSSLIIIKLPFPESDL